MVKSVVLDPNLQHCSNIMVLGWFKGCRQVTQIHVEYNIECAMGAFRWFPAEYLRPSGSFLHVPPDLWAGNSYVPPDPEIRPSESWAPPKKHHHFSNFLRLILSMNAHDEFTTLFYLSEYIGDILTWSIVWDIWFSYPRSDTVESLPSGSMCKQTKGSGGTVYTGLR